MVIRRLHNHNNLQRSFVIMSANQMAELSGALQGHFVRLQSISSRITSGPGDKVGLNVSFLFPLQASNAKVFWPVINKIQTKLNKHMKISKNLPKTIFYQFFYSFLLFT